MAIRTFDDLYPAADPRDGARILRFTHHQQAHYEGVRNGAGTGKITLRGTTTDAQAISPAGLQYVRKGLINTAIADAGTLSGYWEKVIGGYFLEEGDFLALDRRTLRTLSFGGTGTLAYLDREIMWSHSYLSEIDPAYGTQDPFDRLWRLWNQGDWAGGDFLGAVLWRVINEGLAYRTGGTYTHRHADGETYTDSHADDKLETAIPFVTLGFTQYVDSSGNPWTVGSGEFEASVGESLYEVTRRLMEAGLYVELNPDTFELRAWEVANHGRDRTGIAWGANVLRFQAPTAVPSTDRTDGNILNDLKRALRPFIRVTALLTGGGDDTYAVATGSATIPWHRHHASDVNDTAALSAIASRQITARNDAGDTVQVRAKVGNDPADGYYLPGEHALLDDLVTLDTGSGTWDWADAAYPLAKFIITSRRSGAPDVFYELGASYHSSGTNTFTGTGVGKHTHPPNPRLCDTAIPCASLTSADLSAQLATNGDAEAGASTQWSGGASQSSPVFDGTKSYGAASATVATIVYTFDPAQVFTRGTRYVLDFYARRGANFIAREKRFGVPGVDEEVTSEGSFETVSGWAHHRMCWTPSADRTGVRLSFYSTQDASAYIVLDGLSLATAAGSELVGTSPKAARCDHRHRAADVTYNGGASGLSATDVQAAIDALAADTDDPFTTIRVSDYGSVGTSDDTATVQAAIAAAKALSTSALYSEPPRVAILFTAATHTVEPGACVIDFDNVLVYGRGRHSILKVKGGSWSGAASKGALNIVGSSGDKVVGTVIRNMAFDGNKANVTVSTGSALNIEALHLDYADAFLVQDVWVYNGKGDGLDIDNGSDGFVVNVMAYDNDGGGIHPSTGSTRITSIDCAAWNNGAAHSRGGYVVNYASSGNTFIRCVSVDNHYGFDLDGDNNVTVDCSDSGSTIPMADTGSGGNGSGNVNIRFSLGGTSIHDHDADYSPLGHTHTGGDRWEVVMTGSGASLEPVTNDAETDWLYAEAS